MNVAHPQLPPPTHVRVATKWLTFRQVVGAIPLFITVVTAQPSPVVVRLTPTSTVLQSPRHSALHLDRIRKVVIRENGDILTLGTDGPEIDVFENGGRHKSSFAGVENGSKLIAAKSFAVTRGGRVGIIGLFGHSVSVLRLAGDDVRASNALELPFAPASICSVGDDLFVSLAESEGAVFRISSKGTAALAFRVPVPPSIPPMQQHFHDAELMCSSNPEVIVAYTRMMPTVTAFSVSGRLLWKKNLTSFRQIELTQISSKQMVVSTPEGGYDEAISAFQVSPRIVALQYRTVITQKDYWDLARLPQTRFLSLADGAEIGSTNALPAVSAAVGSMAVGQVREDGRLKIYRRLGGSR